MTAILKACAITENIPRDGCRRQMSSGTAWRMALTAGKRKKSAGMIPVPAEVGKNIKTAAEENEKQA